MHITIKEVAEKIADLVIESVAKRLDIPLPLACIRQPSIGMTGSTGMTGPAASVAKPEPVKCKEYWIWKGASGVLRLSTTRCVPYQQTVARVIEPIEEDKYRDKLREKVMLLEGAVTRLTINEIITISKELGMLKEDE